MFYQSADASQQYIQYKYGPEAGDAAKQSVPVAKDMLDGEQAGHNLGFVGAAGMRSNLEAPCAAWAAAGDVGMSVFVWIRVHCQRSNDVCEP